MDLISCTNVNTCACIEMQGDHVRTTRGTGSGSTLRAGATFVRVCTSGSAPLGLHLWVCTVSRCRVPCGGGADSAIKWSPVIEEGLTLCRVQIKSVCPSQWRASAVNPNAVNATAIASMSLSILDLFKVIAGDIPDLRAWFQAKGLLSLHPRCPSCNACMDAVIYKVSFKRGVRV